MTPLSPHNNPHDPFGPVMLLIALMGLGYFMVSHLPILWLHYHFRCWELKGLGLIHPTWAQIEAQILSLPTVDEVLLQNLAAYLTSILRAPVTLVLVLLTALALYHYIKYQGRIHTLSSLMQRLGRHWPACVPLLKVSALHWQEAWSPEDWQRQHRYRLITKSAVITDELTAFLQQDLGRVWRDLSDLSVHECALLILFIAAPFLEIKVLQRLKLDLAQSLTAQGKWQLSRRLKRQLQKLSQRSDFNAGLSDLTYRHAYVRTLLLASLAQARTKIGVWAPADFLWLKVVDRTLWYPLHNLGRQTFHVEALACHNHYQAECRLGQAQHQPQLQEAIHVLQTTLSWPLQQV